MRDSQREPGPYPRRSPSGSPPNQPSRPRPRPDSTGQSRSSARHSDAAWSDTGHRARPPLQHNDLPAGRPKLPSAEESREEQFERTERLRALRKDFLDHAQTKVQPQKPRNVWLAVGLTGALLVLCVVGVIAFFELRPTLFNDAAQTAAAQFMDAMQQKNYDAAYASCSSTVQEIFKDHSGALSKNAFTSQATAADEVGPITGYTLGSPTTIDDTHKQYTVRVIRSKQAPVNITLTLSKGDDGSWKVSGIDSALFPTPSQQPDDSTPTPTSNLPDALALAGRRSNF